MLSNERVRALAALDRDGLIELLAEALARGRGGHYGALDQDPDVRALMQDAARRWAQPDRWAAAVKQWDVEMGALRAPGGHDGR